MKSRYSSGKTTSSFVKHQVYDVATSLTESKYIANDLADAKRYQYRARAVVVGNAAVKPYEAIYLDGLPNGMSGYWTVLSVKHIFGGAPANYMMELDLGTDVLGETSDEAIKATKVRDITGELAGQALVPADSSLKDYALEINGSSLTPTYGRTEPTSVVTPRATAVPETIVSSDPYSVKPPNFSNVKRTTKWEAV
jgi:hypothetical protein